MFLYLLEIGLQKEKHDILIHLKPELCSRIFALKLYFVFYSLFFDRTVVGGAVVSFDEDVAVCCGLHRCGGKAASSLQRGCAGVRMAKINQLERGEVSFGRKRSNEKQTS